jgi:hypothetical protein
VQPAAEVHRAAFASLSIQCQERLLHDVLRLLRTLEDAPGGSVQSPSEASISLSEGVFVAFRAAAAQIRSVGVDLRSLHPLSFSVHETDDRAGQKVGIV